MRWRCGADCGFGRLRYVEVCGVFCRDICQLSLALALHHHHRGMYRKRKQLFDAFAARVVENIYTDRPRFVGPAYPCVSSGERTENSVCPKLRFRSRFSPVIARKISSMNRATFKITFRKLCFAFGLLTIVSLVVPTEAAPPKKTSEVEANATVTPTPTPTAAPTPNFKPESSNTSGSVTVEGSRIDYQAVAGTIVVHPKGWDDAAKPEEQ